MAGPCIVALTRDQDKDQSQAGSTCDGSGRDGAEDLGAPTMPTHDPRLISTVDWLGVLLDAMGMLQRMHSARGRMASFARRLM